MQIEHKKEKPPPIYVQKTTSALNSLEETRYELKATNEIKIQPLETIKTIKR